MFMILGITGLTNAVHCILLALLVDVSLSIACVMESQTVGMKLMKWSA
jgi:hypothetical protein